MNRNMTALTWLLQWINSVPVFRFKKNIILGLVYVDSKKTKQCEP